MLVQLKENEKKEKFEVLIVWYRGKKMRKIILIFFFLKSIVVFVLSPLYFLSFHYLRKMYKQKLVYYNLHAYGSVV